MRRRARGQRSPFSPTTAKAGSPPSTLAAPLFALGDVDRGFEWLQKAVDTRDQSLLLRVDPTYTKYRSDPRFQHILTQVGLDRLAPAQV
jgi:hypothetical protein